MSWIENLHLKSYEQDGRKSIKDIYESFYRLENEFWNKEVLHQQKFRAKRKKPTLPILAFRTKLKGPALWLISGIHGEEPAGPNAISEHIGFLNDLARKIPVVLLPLCNPVGYSLNWRYPDRKFRPRNPEEAKSVGASEHYLQDLKNPHKPRKKKPDCEEAFAITSFVLKYNKSYPPVLVLDFHEDESSRNIYIYSQGKLGANDPVTKEIVKILQREGFKLKMYGKTDFGEKIIEGVVSSVNDGSIDELLGTRQVIINGNLKRKKAAKSVIVIETNTKHVHLSQRMKVHREVLLLSERFYEMARQIGRKNN